MRPHRRQPTRLPRPWDSPGKNTGVGCHILLQCMKVKSESEVTQSCLTLSGPMDCSPPGSSVHGVFQARVLDWGAIAFSGWCLTNKWRGSHLAWDLPGIIWKHMGISHLYDWVKNGVNRHHLVLMGQVLLNKLPIMLLIRNVYYIEYRWTNLMKLIYLFRPCHKTCSMLVPWPGTENGT